jgi:hypothetical protein
MALAVCTVFRRVADAGFPAGGTPEVLLKPDAAKGEIYSMPELLPDGKTLPFTFLTSFNWDEAQIVVRQLSTPACSA